MNLCGPSGRHIYKAKVERCSGQGSGDHEGPGSRLQRVCVRQQSSLALLTPAEPTVCEKLRRHRPIMVVW